MLLDIMANRCNRQRTELEKAVHFPQDKPAMNQPWFQMAVIRMNSTYLECVDRMFEERGSVAAFGGLVLLVSALAFFALVPESFIADIRFRFYWKTPETILICLAMAIPILISPWVIMRQECFRYTHFPIRFNREKRKVHFFRSNGTALTVDWDKLYFTLMPERGRRLRVGALIMEGETVKEFFALPFMAMRGDPLLCSFYEFVRRYMEGDDETVAELARQIMYAPDIVKHREGYWDGVDYLHDLATGGRGFLRMFYPFAMGLGIFRWIVMHTCRIPRWSKEVEVDCAFPPDDPNIRDAQHLSPPVLQAPKIT
jgi:hypothetical protein